MKLAPRSGSKPSDSPANLPSVSPADSGQLDTQAGAAAESFETAVAELDELVHKMESGSLSLEQSLAAYKRGAQLVQYCQKTLADVSQQVQILEAGLFKPFQDAGATAQPEDNA